MVSGGGRLNRLAQKSQTALASFEKNDLAPRQANGLMLYGALGIIKTVFPKTKIKDLAKTFKPEKYRALGIKVAQRIRNKIVVIYASADNNSLGHLWKIH